jgi:mRNA interferase HigB
MVIISKKQIVAFYNKEPQAKEVMLDWYHKTTLSNWSNYHDVKQTFNSVDSIGNDRYIFNVGGTNTE